MPSDDFFKIPEMQVVWWNTISIMALTAEPTIAKFLSPDNAFDLTKNDKIPTRRAFLRFHRIGSGLYGLAVNNRTRRRHLVCISIGGRSLVSGNSLASTDLGMRHAYQVRPSHYDKGQLGQQSEAGQYDGLILEAETDQSLMFGWDKEKGEPLIIFVPAIKVFGAWDWQNLHDQGTIVIAVFENKHDTDIIFEPKRVANELIVIKNRAPKTLRNLPANLHPTPKSAFPGKFGFH